MVYGEESRYTAGRWMMLDLGTLGQELRRRRRALRMPSAELARRIRVSQTYVWLIEGAKPRRSGQSSRPSEELLARWMAALGIEDEEARRLRQLAGYFDPDRARTPGTREGDASRLPVPGYPSSEVGYDTGEAAAGQQPLFQPAASQVQAMQRWARSGSGEGDRHLMERTRALLEQAEQSGRHEEAASLLDSFLRWLAFHLGERR